MKHAYLIIAHNQFRSLIELVSVLDDKRNDIYIHFDKKVKDLPDLHTQFSNLIVLDNRINVIWGDVSQIKTEYVLFEAASASGEDYAYYHLISGTHFPLKSNNDLHEWFAGFNGACVFRHEPISDDEVQMRFGLYHFFLKHLIDKNKFVNKFYHLGWRGLLWVQKALGIRRDTSFIRGKASNWCSLSDDAVKLLLSKEKEVLHHFRRSFCGDEFFVPSVLEDSGLPLVFDDRLCYVEFVNTTPIAFKEKDLELLINTDACFFRKLTDSNLGLAKKIEHDCLHFQ